MKKFVISFVGYTLSNWQSLIVGGVIIVGVVIFLMGILKKLFINKIPNKLGRKIVLSFSSLILVLPVTAVSVIYNRLDMSYFWVFYAINAAATILVYWFYENTGTRDLLSLIGKNALRKFFSGSPSRTEEEMQSVIEDIHTETKEVIKIRTYKEDDLDKL